MMNKINEKTVTLEKSQHNAHPIRKQNQTN